MVNFFKNLLHLVVNSMRYIPEANSNNPGIIQDAADIHSPFMFALIETFALDRNPKKTQGNSHQKRDNLAKINSAAGKFLALSANKKVGDNFSAQPITKEKALRLKKASLFGLTKLGKIDFFGFASLNSSLRVLFSDSTYYATSDSGFKAEKTAHFFYAIGLLLLSVVSLPLKVVLFPLKLVQTFLLGLRLTLEAQYINSKGGLAAVLGASLFIVTLFHFVFKQVLTPKHAADDAYDWVKAKTGSLCAARAAYVMSFIISGLVWLPLAAPIVALAAGLLTAVGLGAVATWVAGAIATLVSLPFVRPLYTAFDTGLRKLLNGLADFISTKVFNLKGLSALTPDSAPDYVNGSDTDIAAHALGKAQIAEVLKAGSTHAVLSRSLKTGAPFRPVLYSDNSDNNSTRQSEDSHNDRFSDFGGTYDITPDSTLRRNRGGISPDGSILIRGSLFVGSDEEPYEVSSQAEDGLDVGYIPNP